MSISFNAAKLSPGGTFQPMTTPPNNTARDILGQVNTQMKSPATMGLNFDAIFDSNGSLPNWA